LFVLSLENLGKEEQTKPKTCRKEELVQTRVERVHSKDSRRTTKTRSLFFGKINRIEKPLANLVKKKERVWRWPKSVMKEGHNL
jgi:hypothetical protein